MHRLNFISQFRAVLQLFHSHIRVSYGKPGSPYCVVLYYQWGCRRKIDYSWGRSLFYEAAGFCFVSLPSSKSTFSQPLKEKMYRLCCENWQYKFIFMRVSYENPGSPYCVMQHFWWGCSRNLALITLDFMRLQAFLLFRYQQSLLRVEPRVGHDHSLVSVRRGHHGQQRLLSRRNVPHCNQAW